MRVSRYAICLSLAVSLPLIGVSCRSEKDAGAKVADKRQEGERTPRVSELSKAITRLIGQLRHDPNDENSRGALAALGEVTIPALKQSLKDPDPDFRVGIVQTLGAIPSDASFEALLMALTDQDEDVRISTVEGLGELANPRALPSLLTLYENDENDQVRYEILTTLGLIGAPSTVPFLVKETSSDDRYVRMWAADALCRMGASEATDVSVRLLGDPEKYVRARILTACGAFLARGDSQAALVHLAINGEDFAESVHARRILQKLIATPGSEELRERMKTVARAALEGDRALYGAFVLADLNDPSGMDVLRQNYQTEDSFVRHHIAFELGRLSGASSVPILATMLNDPVELVAATAYDALLMFVDQGNQEAAAAVASYTGKKFPVRLKDLAAAR